MFNYAHVKNNKVIGTQSSTNSINSPELIELAANQAVNIGDDYDSVTNTFIAPVAPTLAEVKAAKITQIKVEAANRITALDWKVTRATERNDGTLSVVYAEREAIRTASNQTEIDVNALTTVDAVNNFVW